MRRPPSGREKQEIARRAADWEQNHKAKAEAFKTDYLSLCKKHAMHIGIEDNGAYYEVDAVYNLRVDLGPIPETSIHGYSQEDPNTRAPA